MVNKYCHGQQDKVCNHKGNHLPLVDNGYYVYYYWLLFYSQLPKYQYLIYDWSENVLNKNVVVVARGERLCSLPFALDPNSQPSSHNYYHHLDLTPSTFVPSYPTVCTQCTTVSRSFLGKVESLRS